MKLTDMPVTDAEKYITDDAWVMEQKFDGARALVEVDTEAQTTRWFSGSGGPLKFAAAAQHFDEISHELLEMLTPQYPRALVNLDGELMHDSGIYRVFDKPDAYRPYELRRRDLESIFAFNGWAMRARSTVRPVEQAVGQWAKTDMWERINAAGVEGAVCKRLDSLYVPGARSKDQIKLKLIKTADVVVAAINNWTKTTGSCDLQVLVDPTQDPEPYLNAKGKRAAEPGKASEDWNYTPRVWLPVGSSSLIGKDPTIEVGSVVEVTYLYWTGKAVIQPRIMRKRDDKLALECLLDQFPKYSRRAV